jgi:Ion channel
MFYEFLNAIYRIFIGRYNEDESQNNWIVERNYQDYTEFQLYVASFYFTVTTIVTVGYGDITAQSSSEKSFCIFLMLIGVMSFSFTTGALASIIASYDSKESQLKEKMSTLHDIQKEYKINHEMFNELSKTVQYNHRKKSKDLIHFMEELPHKLKLELAMVIH